MRHPEIIIKIALWKKLIKELKKRGAGKNESGAFLLGPKGGNEITKIICYDDLDPDAFDTGIIIFNGDGYIPLWEICSVEGLKVLADVHTHPGSWTGQSASDMKNPMIAQSGHIALIVPQLATNKKQLLNGVGVHEFLSKRKWKRWENPSQIIQLIK